MWISREYTIKNRDNFTNLYNLQIANIATCEILHKCVYIYNSVVIICASKCSILH